MREGKLLKQIRQVKVMGCVLALLISISASANEGKAMPWKAKSSVPINYYEWLMVSIAVSYALYLIIRAKRRAKGKI